MRGSGGEKQMKVGIKDEGRVFPFLKKQQLQNAKGFASLSLSPLQRSLQQTLCWLRRPHQLNQAQQARVAASASHQIYWRI